MSTDNDNIDHLRRKILKLVDIILVLAIAENPKNPEIVLELPINILTNTAFKGYVWCRRTRSKQECIETVVGLVEEKIKSSMEKMKKLLDEADQFENLDDIKLGMLIENMKESASKYDMKIL